MEQGGADVDMLCLQREHEKQGAMFSCFYWAVFSWNLEETSKRRTQIPNAAHWTKVLVSADEHRILGHACHSALPAACASIGSEYLPRALDHMIDY